MEEIEKILNEHLQAQYNDISWVRCWIEGIPEASAALHAHFTALLLAEYQKGREAGYRQGYLDTQAESEMKALLAEKDRKIAELEKELAPTRDYQKRSEAYFNLKYPDRNKF